MKNEQFNRLLQHVESLITGGAAINVQIINIESLAKPAFEGTYRAMARFHDPIDETDIEKVDRLYKDGVSWKRRCEKRTRQRMQTH